MKKVNGFIFEGENEYGNYAMTVTVEGDIITVESQSCLGRTIVFNEPVCKFSSIAELCDELHEQNLEDLEQAIWDKYNK